MFLVLVLEEILEIQRIPVIGGIKVIYHFNIPYWRHKNSISKFSIDFIYFYRENPLTSKVSILSENKFYDLVLFRCQILALKE